MILPILLLVGCKSVQYVPVEKVHDVYHNTTDTIRDSIYHNVLVREYTKGDTVYKDRTERIYLDKWRIKHDTVAAHDTIPQPYAVERKLTVYEKVKENTWLTLFLLLIASGIALYISIKTRK